MTKGGKLLNDRQIIDLCACEEPMISPFSPTCQGKPSWGLGSTGYDIRLGYRFLIPRDWVKMEGCLSPIADSEGLFIEKELEGVCVIPPNSFVLGESVETFHMPDDVVGVCWGKSSYARLGVLVNVTPLEVGWTGRLTIEIANLGPLPVSLILGQGIAQLVFFYTNPPERTYAERESGGIYQDQKGVLLPA